MFCAIDGLEHLEDDDENILSNECVIDGLKELSHDDTGVG